MRPTTLSFNDLNLAAALAVKGHTYLPAFDSAIGLVAITFNRTDRLLSDVAEYHAGSYDRNLLEMRTQLYREIRQVRGGSL